jgi:hypothetical protein
MSDETTEKLREELIEAYDTSRRVPSQPLIHVLYVIGKILLITLRLPVAR